MAEDILDHFFPCSSLGNIDGYFTAIMLKKPRVKLLKHEIIPFPTTSMMRNLLVVYVSESDVLNSCISAFKKKQERLDLHYSVTVSNSRRTSCPNIQTQLHLILTNFNLLCKLLAVLCFQVS